MYDGIVKYKVEYDTDGAKRQVVDLSKTLDTVGAKMTTAISMPIAGLALGAVKLASDYSENLNKVNVAFGDSSKQVVEWSKTTLEKFGIANVTALGMVSTFGDIGTAMGQTTDEASKMGTNLVGLAGDLASFKNISLDRANTALTGIYTGEGEALKSLGVIMTDQTIETYLATKGIEKNWKEMSQAEKVNIRYQYVMEMTSKAQGDFARTSEGVANQARTAKERIKELGVEMGQKLEPYAIQGLEAINDVIDGFSGLDDQAKDTIIKIGAVALAIGPTSQLVANAGKLGTFLISPWAVALTAIGAYSIGIKTFVDNYDKMMDKDWAGSLPNLREFVEDNVKKGVEAFDAIEWLPDIGAPMGPNVLDLFIPKETRPKNGGGGYFGQSRLGGVFKTNESKSSATIGSVSVSIYPQSYSSTSDATKVTNEFLKEMTNKLGVVLFK